MPSPLGDLSKPSDGDHPSQKAILRKAMRRKATREKLHEVAAKEVRHLKNAAEHRGHFDALGHACNLTEIVAIALAQTQPYHPDGSKRKGGDLDEYWCWLRHMKDLLALRLPYERPRLASITMREERPEDSEEYTTVYELRARMTKKGISVDHLIDRPLMLEHELPDDSAGEHTTNGHATNGK